MKRVLCGLMLGGTALLAVPAHATNGGPYVVVDQDHAAVGATLGSEPVGGASVDFHTGAVCAGIGYWDSPCVQPTVVTP